MEWIKRRLKHSYSDLWKMVYGYEQSKGLIRELDFYAEAAAGWKTSYQVVKRENDRLIKELEGLSQNEKKKAE